MGVTKKATKAETEPSELRRHAEERLRAETRSKEAGLDTHPHDLQRLVHELEVYQIELQMQNEGLQTARRELEIGLARYTELFDFAPFGYATLDAREVIEEINVAGARLLGAERKRLVGQPFQNFLVTGQHMAFSTLLGQAAENEPTEACE